MSFGFGVGDFLAVIKLATTIRKTFATAPDHLKAVSDEVKSLSILLWDIEVEVDNLDVSTDRSDKIHDILSGAQSVLKDLEAFLKKHDAVSGKGVKRIWARINFETADARDLRDRLSAHVSMLRAFLERDLKDAVVKLTHHVDEQDRRQILDWVGQDHSAQQRSLLQRRQPGTRKWLLESPEWKRWIDTKGSTLYCPGIPGAGKTITTAIVIEQLQKLADSNKTWAVSYIFCDYKRCDEEALQEALAGALLRTLLEQCSIPANLRQWHTEPARLKQGLRSEHILESLCSCASQKDRVFIIVDALDEIRTEQRRSLVSGLLKLQARPDININMFFTSRKISEISMLFPADRIELEISATEEDVRSYLAREMTNLPSVIRKNQQLQEEIQQAILQSAAGMFLLAELHVHSIKGKFTASAVRAALSNLSTGTQEKASAAYEDAYEKAMQRIQDQGDDVFDFAKQTFLILSHAMRPLRAIELCHALSIPDRPSTFEFDMENVPDIVDVLSVCAGLVIHQAETDILSDESEKPSLTNITKHLGFSQLANELGVMSRVLVWACENRNHNLVGMLLEPGLPQIDDQLDESLEVAARLGDSKITSLLLEHGANPVRHLEQNDSILDVHSESDIKNLHRDSKRAERIKWRYKIASGRRTPRSRIANSPLSLATFHGHTHCLQIILNWMEEHSSNWPEAARQQTYAFAILSAIAGKNYQYIPGLLALGCSIDSVSAHLLDPTLFHLVCRWGELVPIQMMLDHGAATEYGEATLTTTDIMFETVLNWLITNGMQDVVRDILNRPTTNLNAHDEDGHTLLSIAIRQGNVELLQLLLERSDLDINKTDNTGRTPLSHVPGAFRPKSLLEHLLQRQDIDPNTPDLVGRTPLPYAAEVGFIHAHESADVFSLLLQTANIKPDDPDANGRTPLSYAAEHGIDEVVSLLLQCADINADCPDAYGRTPLSWAAGTTYNEHVVRSLLQRIWMVVLHYPGLHLLEHLEAAEPQPNSAPEDEFDPYYKIKKLWTDVRSEGDEFWWAWRGLSVYSSSNRLSPNRKCGCGLESLLFTIPSIEFEGIKGLLLLDPEVVAAGNKGDNKPLEVAVCIPWNSENVATLESMMGSDQGTVLATVSSLFYNCFSSDSSTTLFLEEFVSEARRVRVDLFDDFFFRFPDPPNNYSLVVLLLRDDRWDALLKLYTFVPALVDVYDCKQTEHLEGHTRFARATVLSTSEVVRALMAAKHHDDAINLQGEDGRTALSFFIGWDGMHEDPAVLEVLLQEASLQADIPDNAGLTPLHHALLRAYEDIGNHEKGGLYAAAIEGLYQRQDANADFVASSTGESARQAAARMVGEYWARHSVQICLAPDDEPIAVLLGIIRSELGE
ncbi:hypothetical protein PG988_012394 [Apiospora saccharicola]